MRNKNAIAFRTVAELINDDVALYICFALDRLQRTDLMNYVDVYFEQGTKEEQGLCGYFGMPLRQKNQKHRIIAALLLANMAETGDL